MFQKFKEFLLSRRKEKNKPRLTGPGGRRIPHAIHNQPALLGTDRAATGQVIAISSPDQKPIAANPISGASLSPPEQSNRTASKGASTSVMSDHPVDTQSHSGSGRHPTLGLPSPGLQQDTPQGSPVTADLHSIQHATFHQGTFSNAQNVHIGTAYMSDYGQSGNGGYTEQERKEKEKRAKVKRESEGKKQEKEALEKLAAKGMPSAMLDSKDRGYVPRCNEDTRMTLRGRIIEWNLDGKEARRLLWLSGPAGVGKSAVAQTVSEELSQRGLLGAAFFFSRPNNRSDPDIVIPTLVYQLALLLPEYRHIISQLFIKDPLILNKSRRSQFRELIIDPFLSLTAQFPLIIQKPLLVVLDGLDECSDREAQCELVDMITHHTHKAGAALRLRWLICSRPEPDLKIAFTREDCRAICVEEKLEVDEIEARKDARLILTKGFTEIREKYPDQLTKGWPPEDQVSFIAGRASGHLGFASFLIRFIGDEDYGDPSGQLDICLKFLERAVTSTDLNPLHALDLLYTQILSDIPTNILPTTQRILGLFIFNNNLHLTVAAHANFLRLDQVGFYRSLRRLHSVLFVPPVSEAGWNSIKIYHASFSDYLKDPARSGKFFLEEGLIPHLDIAMSGLQWLGYGHSDFSKRSRPELTWIPPDASREIVLASLCRFSFIPCWEACLKVPRNSLTTLFKALDKFDFNLQYETMWETETRDFAYFIRWLVISRKALVKAGDRRQAGIILWHQDDPNTFGLPFPKGIRPWGPGSLYLRVGKNNPAHFLLEVDPSYKPHFG